MDNTNVPKTDEDIDEVSLPGVGDNEQPTILEVLNRGIVDIKEDTGTGTESTSKKDEISTNEVTSKLEDDEPEKPLNYDKESDNLVIRNSSSGSQSQWNEPPQRSQLNDDEEEYVYDIESHLIETLKNYSVSEDSDTWGVDIKELPPAEGESLHRTSKIETDPLIGTVVEVEPASPKIFRPVETSITEPQRQSVLEQKAQIKQNSPEPTLQSSNECTNSSNAQRSNSKESYESEKIETESTIEESKPIWTVVRELQSEFETKNSTNTDTIPKLEFGTPNNVETSLLSTEEANLKLDGPHSVQLTETHIESKGVPETSPIVDSEPSNSRFDSLECTVGTDTIRNFEVSENSEKLVEKDQILSTHEFDVEKRTEKTSLAVNLEELISPTAKEEYTSSEISIQPTHAKNIQIEQTVPLSNNKEETTGNATIKQAIENTKTEDSASLTQEIDQKLSELSTHLSGSTKVDLNGNISKLEQKNLNKESKKAEFDINGLPLPRSAAEEEQRREFLDSLPQVSLETDSNKAAALAKREYYQSLRQYLITHADRPPVPPETYRWEDLKRAKQRGGYPWTHLHKRPLGPDEEPEIVLLLRKSQELRFASESPKSFKKVRIDDQVSIKETERYIQELSDNEENSQTEEEEEDEHEDERSECISCVSDSVLSVEKKASKLGKLRGILKKRSPKKEVDSRSLPDTTTDPSTSYTSNHKSAEDVRGRQSRQTKEETPHKAKCFPIMKKLKSMADRQKKNFRNIKKISLKKEDKIPLDEEQKIIKLKTSPKAVHSEIPHFIEKQDSDDVLEIIELDESPSRKRKDQLELQEQASAESTVLVPDEIIDIPTTIEDNISDRQQTPEPTVSEILEEELKSSPIFSAPPKKAARLRREHVYEDIEDTGDSVSEEINNILQQASIEALKQSLAMQDSSTMKDVEATKTTLSFERMGSSEEEMERTAHLAPICSIDSASSEEERKPHLSPVSEESDAASHDETLMAKDDEKHRPTVLDAAKERNEHLPWTDIELKPVLKKEASPAPSEKKVTFSHVEDEAEPHREDIELPEGLRGMGPKRWSNLSDHEYEPIGEPATEIQKEHTPEPAYKKEPSPAPVAQELPKSEISQLSMDVPSDDVASLEKSDELKEAEELQKDLEDRYFSKAASQETATLQRDYEMQTSQVDSSALEELPMQAESRKKSFMASAQDKTRKMQAGFKNQAGKIKTKFRTPKKAPSGSPKAKERKRFKAPEFSKIKMPEMKRPEFTKFSKPDMSKFKLPDKFSSLKLNRSKSFKEPTEIDDTTVSGTSPESNSAPPKKQRFDFSFGTYPRAFRRKPKPQEVESTLDEPSVIQSTETQPSAESSSTPQGDRGPGPVRSRWADKFSDVSYNDSEGSRYRRFESEQESSFDRESSMERRMKEVLEENEKEEAELAMLGVVEQKQFADYDEENRVIHEISKTREREFKRRPMVHQDSDIMSEEVGWTQREAEKNQILRKAELEAEPHIRYQVDREYNPDTQSTASSKKFVFEEINDDEFLLRKKGASRESSIGQQRFQDSHKETGYDDLDNEQGGSLNGSSIDRVDYGYDIPPPKPRRLSHQQRQRHYDSENASQIGDYGDDISLSQADSDYFRHAPPSRPLRKGRFKNSQDMSIGGTPSIQYDDEDYTSDRKRNFEEEKENILQEQDDELPLPPPQPPRRRRKQMRDSLEKDSFVNGFGGRSVSNSYLREDNKPEEVIVYRTEHEYKIPLATHENYNDTTASATATATATTTATATARKSKSLSRLGYDEDDRTSHGAESLALDHAMRGELEDASLNAEELHEKYIIEMMENDGYAVVRKENLPKPTPPARRKKFARSPGERFATMPHARKTSPFVSEQKFSTGNYSTIGKPTPPRRRSAHSLTADSQKEFGSQDLTDYEEPELDERPESPRNLQSGDIINKMKYRPLPPPPRPPREKRHPHRHRHGDDDDDEIESRDDDRDGGGERINFESLSKQSSDDYNQQQNVEVEVSTQTDPLPDDFVCEEFEITEDMKVIEPRRSKTLDEILKEEEEADLERAKQIDAEVLARGIQRFREASQRSASDKSRASSVAKSLSRPQTPSAILIEKRIPTPVPNSNGQTVLEASLIVQPIDDLDLEEELLRREGLYDGSHSKSDAESYQKEEDDHVSEEENEKIDEEVCSYTRSTDVESQHHEDEEQEQDRLEEEVLEAKRIQEEEEEEAMLLEELDREKRFLEEALRKQAEEEIKRQKLEEEERLLEEEEERLAEEEQRLQEQEEEELRLLEEEERRILEKERQRIQAEEDEERRILEKEQQRIQAEEEEERRILEKEQQRIQAEEEEELRLQEEELRLLKKEQQRIQQEKEELRIRKEAEERKLLEKELQRIQEEKEEEQLRRLEEEHRRYLEEEEQSIQEEEEQTRKFLEDLKREDKLLMDSRSEEHGSCEEEPNERLKDVDSFGHKSDLSEEKDDIPIPSARASRLPPKTEEEISVLQLQNELYAQVKKHQPQSNQELSPPPMAPPRKRSTADHTESLSVTEQQNAPVPFTGVMPSHLAIADLEVERLRVHALQAGQIMVSHLHGAQIQAEELDCRSGNLVVKNIEFPPGFIEDIVERVRSTEREHSQVATQTISEARTQTDEDSIPPPPIPTRQPEVPPVRPPPPLAAHFLNLHDQEQPSRNVNATEYLHTIPSIGFYNQLHPDDDGEMGAAPPPVYRRRRHHRRRDSSSDDDQHRRHSRSVRPEQPPQSIAQAGRQLITACSLPLANVINQLTNAIRPNNNDNNKGQVQPRNISTVVVLFIVMTLSFLIYLLTGRNIHHHHWDYFNPPGNDGRLS